MNHHLSACRDGSPYVFSQRDTAEGYASALRTIGGMADEDVPLRRLASRADLESRLREHDFVIAFVNATDGTAEDESEASRSRRKLEVRKPVPTPKRTSLPSILTVVSAPAAI